MRAPFGEMEGRMWGGGAWCTGGAPLSGRYAGNDDVAVERSQQPGLVAVVEGGRSVRCSSTTESRSRSRLWR